MRVYLTMFLSSLFCFIFFLRRFLSRLLYVYLDTSTDLTYTTHWQCSHHLRMYFE
jgi:hypothetical protein